MNLRTASSLLLLSALTLGALLPRVALATPSLDACTGVLQREAGTTTTITVDAPGTWCLDQDLVEDVDVPGATFTMITVAADDVTIDCRGHRLEYTGMADYMEGIATPIARQRLTVRNCRFQGFSRAIASGTSHGFLFEDNTVHASRRGNSPVPATAISAFGGGIIRRNQIHDSVHRAITAGYDSLVEDNLIDGVTSTDDNDFINAIDLYFPTAMQVRGNTIRGLQLRFSYSALRVAAVQVNGDAGSRVRIVDNVVVGQGGEDTFAFGLSGGDVRYSDNVLAGFSVAARGGTDGGDNDLTP